jgi:putative ABC transport system permease protein
MWSDLVLSLRRMRRRPGMWLIVVLNLTIGLTGVIAAFSVVRAVLLRQLPYPNPDRLVLIWEDNSKRGVGLTPNSALNMHDVLAATHAFESAGLLNDVTVTFYGKTEAEPIKVYLVTSGALAVANTQPLLGRVLTAHDDEPGTPRVVVLSYGFWQRRFGGDPSIVGREIILNGETQTVVGVMPKGFTLPPTFRTVLIGTNLLFPEPTLWVSMKANELPPLRRTRQFMTLARLVPGVTVEQVQSELSVIGHRLATDYPDVDMGLDYRIVPLSQQVFGTVRPVLIVVFVVALLVLILSMANAIHILLVDLSYRLSELALRAALGATTMAIVRQLAIANLTACVMSTALALLAARVIVSLVSQASDAGVARLSESAIDGPVILFTAALALVVAFATTILTVRQVIGREIAGIVRNALSGGGALRRVLLVTHVATVIAVMAVAGTLARSWWRLSAVDSGVRSDGVVVLEFILPASRYDTPARRIDFQRQMLTAVAGAGLQPAATADFYPYSDYAMLANVTVDKRVPKDAYDEPKAQTRGVSPDYFQVLGIPLLSGRLFDARDDGREPVAVLSDAFVRRFGDGHEMLGRRIKISTVDPALWVTVIGIVGSTHGAGLSLPAQPEILFPYGMSSKRATLNVLVHSTQPRGALLAALHDAVQRVDGQLQPTVSDMADHVAKSIGRSRLYGSVFGILATLAILLGASGIYGAQSLLVSRKSRDIGVRLCLGAEPDEIVRALLVRFAYTACIGVAVGVAAAVIAQRQLADALYGVTAPDWLTIAASATLVIALGIAATYWPARQACRQPLRALLTDVEMRASG